MENVTEEALQPFVRLYFMEFQSNQLLTQITGTTIKDIRLNENPFTYVSGYTSDNNLEVAESKFSYFLNNLLNL